MSRKNTLALVRYRLEQADDALRAAHIISPFRVETPLSSTLALPRVKGTAAALLQ
jgi:hypothetical protein